MLEDRPKLILDAPEEIPPKSEWEELEGITTKRDRPPPGIKKIPDDPNDPKATLRKGGRPKAAYSNIVPHSREVIHQPHHGGSNSDKGKRYATTKVKLEDLMKAVDKFRGNVALAAEWTGVHRTTFWEYIKRYPELKDRIMFFRIRNDEVAKNNFVEALENKEPWAIQKWLQYRGHKYGFIDQNKIQIGGDPKNPLKIGTYSEELTDDDRVRILVELARRIQQRKLELTHQEGTSPAPGGSEPGSETV